MCVLAWCIIYFCVFDGFFDKMIIRAHITKTGGTVLPTCALHWAGDTTQCLNDLAKDLICGTSRNQMRVYIDMRVYTDFPSV